jgi:hypothetical protein
MPENVFTTDVPTNALGAVAGTSVCVHYKMHSANNIKVSLLFTHDESFSLLSFLTHR